MRLLTAMLIEPAARMHLPVVCSSALGWEHRGVMYGYQDESFVVDEVAGASLRSLTLFLEDGLPQKLLGELENGPPFQCYLSAFIGLWSGLLDLEVQEIRDDYALCEARDLAAEHGLTGATIERAVCRRVDGRVQIQIVLDRGTVILSEVDPSDPHSDAELTFLSS